MWEGRSNRRIYMDTESQGGVMYWRLVVVPMIEVAQDILEQHKDIF